MGTIRGVPAAMVLVVLVVLVGGVVGVVWRTFGERTLPRGRVELSALKADPVLAIRAPGTRLRNQSEHAASKRWDIKAPDITETRIEQLFSMQGDPGEAVAFYRAGAEAAGWDLAFEGCSRAEQATGLAFTRTINGYHAGLAIRAQLATSPGASRPERHLAVMMGPVSNRPVDAGTRRNDLHCLTGLDPSDPSLIPPTPGDVASEKLCEHLRAVAPEAARPGVVVIPAPSGCILDGGSLLYIELEQATRPLAYYEDRSVTGVDTNGAFLYSDPVLTGAWAMTARGPVVVKARGVNPDRLLRMAAALSTRPS